MGAKLIRNNDALTLAMGISKVSQNKVPGLVQVNGREHLRLLWQKLTEEVGELIAASDQDDRDKLIEEAANVQTTMYNLVGVYDEIHATPQPMRVEYQVPFRQQQIDKERGDYSAGWALDLNVFREKFFGAIEVLTKVFPT